MKIETTADELLGSPFGAASTSRGSSIREKVFRLFRQVTGREHKFQIVNQSGGCVNMFFLNCPKNDSIYEDIRNMISGGKRGKTVKHTHYSFPKARVTMQGTQFSGPMYDVKQNKQVKIGGQRHGEKGK